MDTIMLLAKNVRDAHESVTYLCTDIQNTPACEHKVFLSRLPYGGFYICLGSKDENGERHMTGEREVLIIDSDLAETMRQGKNVILSKNCMSIAGEGNLKILRRKAVIDWLLDISRLDYSAFGLEDES